MLFRRPLRALACLPALGLLVMGLPSAPVAAATQKDVQAQIDKLGAEISDLDEQYNQASIRLQKVQSEIQDSQNQGAKAQADFLALQKVASAQAAAIYRAGAPSLVVAFLSSKNLDDFNKKMELISQVSDWQSGIMTSLQIADQRAKVAQSDLSRQLSQQKSINDSLAKQRNALNDRLASEQKLLGQITEANRQAAAKAAADRAAAVRSAMAVAKAAVAATKSSSSPSPSGSSGSSNALPADPTTDPPADAVRAAMSQIGKPYVWAGSGPASYDCSGLTMSSWRQAGVMMGHSAADQYASFKHVSTDQLQPGDLVFFGHPIHHVGMYVGGGMMVHAPETGELVQVSPVSRGDLVGASRPGV
ncbi:MAG: peptidoglycan DL-endopeptidase CwlO [Actinomycetota bacterium]|nr:peptidoglycan DL-endopeptidase CwlO [Actinomycetota bacterium]